MEYGLQMYSVRDITKENMEFSLKRVSEMGYKYVEFAGFFNIPAETIAEWLGKYGLRVSSTHTGWTEVAEALEATIAYHKAIGNKNIIIPGADLSDQAKLDAFIAMVNEAQPKLAKEGITLGYHNHSREFIDNADGSNIYEQLVARTNLFLEIDTYWAFVAKQDPVALMERLKDRLHFIHIKDGSAEGVGTPLGMGVAPIVAVYKKAAELNVPMVVESETLKPDGLTEAAICIGCLKGIEKSL